MGTTSMHGRAALDMVEVRDRRPSGPVTTTARDLPVKWIACALSVLIAAALPAQKGEPPGTVVTEPFGSRCDQLVRNAAPRYWGAVLVARSGEIALAKGYGYADRQKMAMGPQAVFDFGPASELLTRALVLQLVGAGKLRRAEPVQKLLPEWPADTPAPTLEQLLRRTSGFPAELALPQAQRQQAAAVVRALAKTAPRPGGEQWTPLDARALALCAEAAGQQRFDKLLGDLLGQAGMATAGPTSARFDSRLMTLRRSNQNERGEPANVVPYDWAVRGSSAVLGSVYDLHHFARWLAGGAFGGEDLDELLRPVAGGKEFAVAQHGVGPERAVAIASETAGYRLRLLVHLPSRSWCALLADDLTAVDAVLSALQAELATAWLAARPAGAAPVSVPAVAAFEPQRWIGTFALPGDGGRFLIESGEAGLVLRAEGIAAVGRLQTGCWPTADSPLLARLGERAQAALERLARGDAAVLGEWFASAGAGQAASDLVGELRAECGALRAVEPLLAAREPRLVQVRWVGAGGAAVLAVKLQADLRVLEVVPHRGPCGAAVPLAVQRSDWASARSLGGAELRLSMEGRPGRRTLVWSDATPGPNGLIECAEVVGR